MKDQKNMYLRKTKHDKFSYKMGVLNEKRCIIYNIYQLYMPKKNGVSARRKNTQIGGERTRKTQPSAAHSSRPHKTTRRVTPTKKTISSNTFYLPTANISEDEYVRIYTRVTNTRDWRNKTARQLKIEESLLRKIKNEFDFKKLPKYFLDDVESTDDCRILKHLGELTKKSPMLPLLEWKYDLQIDESGPHLKTSMEYDENFRENYSYNENVLGNVSVRKNIVNAVKKFSNYYTSNSVKSHWEVYDIPIYFAIILGGEHGFHASMIVMYQKRLYSLGLGYANSYVHPFVSKTLGKAKLPHHYGQAALYSPDYLIELEDRRNRVIDIGILTNQHLEKIKTAYASSVNEIIVGLYPNSYPAVKDIMWAIDPTHGNNLNYCEISLQSDKSSLVNCTSFISSIFPNIDCRFFAGIVRPNSCYTKPPLDKDTIIGFYAYYVKNNMSDLVELLTKEEDDKKQSKTKSKSLPKSIMSSVYRFFTR